MRRSTKTILFFSSLAGLALAGIVFAVERNPRPGLIVDPEELDFGSVVESNQFEHTLKVANNSGKPVSIKRFATSCKCVAIEPASVSLAPGENVQLRVSLDLRATTPEVDGTRRCFSATVVPVSDDESSTSWTLRGVVDPFPVKLDPPFLRWIGSCTPDDSRSITFEYDAVDIDGFEVSKSENVTAEPVLSDGRWKLIVTPRVREETGSFFEVLEISPQINGKKAVGAIGLPLFGYSSELGYPNDPEGDDLNGAADNRYRNASCTQVCDPTFFPPGITIMGLASDCTSNQAWKDTSLCGEECVEDDGCGGTGDVICAPVL